MKNLIKKIFVSIFSTSFAIFIPVTVFAQKNQQLDTPLGNISSITDMANALFKLGIAACVVAACIYIAIGSFYYFVAAGSNAKTAEKGKEIIERAIIGLVLALISWIILNTIHPQFAKELKDPQYGGTSN